MLALTLSFCSRRFMQHPKNFGLIASFLDRKVSFLLSLLDFTFWSCSEQGHVPSVGQVILASPGWIQPGRVEVDQVVETAVASLVLVVTSFAHLVPHFIHAVSVQAGKPFAFRTLGSEVPSSLNHSGCARLCLGRWFVRAQLSKAALRQQPRGAGHAVRHQAHFSRSHLLTLKVLGLG